VPTDVQLLRTDIFNTTETKENSLMEVS